LVLRKAAEAAAAERAFTEHLQRCSVPGSIKLYILDFVE
jgi:hypothetical protein